MVYVIRESSTVPIEVENPLNLDSYHGNSGIPRGELVSRLFHNGMIYKHDNPSVYMNIEKAERGTSVGSIVRAFSRLKYGRGVYIALVYNHAGNTKYGSIINNCINLLQKVKWNGRLYPLETHVSNHC